MKRLLSVFAALLLLAALLPVSAAPNMAEYKDDIYSFRYPGQWKRGTAKDGTITLRIPDSGDGVMTFALKTNIVQLTGDKEKDDAFVRDYLSKISKIGSHIKLDGTYELVEQSGLHGFRAFGKADGRVRVEMVMLTGETGMASFVFIGEKAVAAEETILPTVHLMADALGEETEDADYKRWKGSGFSLLYPKGYGTMEQKTGIAFVEMKIKKDMIMACVYTLKAAYSDDQALSIAKAKLPKSTRVKAEPRMVNIGGRDAAVITGNSKAGPMAFYIIGSGRTALGLMFIGKDAMQYAEKVISSVAFGQ